MSIHESSCLLCLSSSIVSLSRDNKELKSYGKAWSSSLCKLLDIDTAFKGSFSKSQYCVSCFELILNVHHSIKVIKSCEKQLVSSRKIIKDYLISNYKSMKYKEIYEMNGSEDSKHNLDTIYQIVGQLMNFKKSLNLRLKKKLTDIRERDKTQSVEHQLEDEKVNEGLERSRYSSRVIKRPKGFDKESIFAQIKIDPDLEEESNYNTEADNTNDNDPDFICPQISDNVKKESNKFQENVKKMSELNDSAQTSLQAPIKKIKASDLKYKAKHILKLSKIRSLRAAAKNKRNAKPPKRDKSIQAEIKLKRMKRLEMMEIREREGELNHDRNKMLRCNFPYCIECDVKFRDSTDARIHISKYHSQEDLETPFHCLFCELRFSLPSEFTAHQKEAHDQSPWFTCNVCNKGFWQHANYIYHKKSIHPPHLMLPKCSTCHKTFSNEEDNSKHEELHAVQLNHEIPFACVICQAHISNMLDLRKHVLMEHEANTLKCDQCSYTCLTAHKMYCHKKYHEDDPKKHKCPKCEFRTRTKSEVKRHMLRHEEPRLVCDFPNCGLKFYTPYLLRKHSSKHAGSKHRFKCSLCPKTFFNISSLKTHQIHHSGVREFLCEVCSFAFKSDRNLATHMNVHKKRGEILSNRTRIRRGRLGQSTTKDFASHHSLNVVDKNPTHQIPIDVNDKAHDVIQMQASRIENYSERTDGFELVTVDSLDNMCQNLMHHF